MDPLTFNPESLIGIPHIFEVYRKGNVALINAPGNGIADDKGIYYFVPKMIKYYLGEEPILNNAPTYLPFYEDDRKYVLEHFDKLVIKDVAEAGGYGVVFGSGLTAEQKERYPVALLPGSILNGQYVVGRVLGQGGFGITYLAGDGYSHLTA